MPEREPVPEPGPLEVPIALTSDEDWKKLDTAVYLAHAFLAFLPIAALRGMNNLRGCNALDSSIPIPSFPIFKIDKDLGYSLGAIMPTSLAKAQR